MASLIIQAVVFTPIAALATLGAVWLGEHWPAKTPARPGKELVPK